MNARRSISALALTACGLLTLRPDPASAQRTRASFDVSGDVGWAFPVGELADYTESGFHAGLKGSFWFNDRFAIRVLGSMDLLDGEESGVVGETPLPDMNLYFLGAGVVFDLVPAWRETPWSLEVTLGGGAGTVDLDNYVPDGIFQEADLDETYPYVGGGLELGYALTPVVHLEAGVHTRVLFIVSLDFQPLYEENALADPTDQFVSTPLSLGIRLDFPPIR